MDYIFLIITAQGFFLSFLIFFKKPNRQANIFLSTLIFVFSLIFLFWFGIRQGFFIKHIRFNFMYMPFPYLIGPLFLFYTKSMLRKFKTKDFLHLIPFILIIIYLLPYYILTDDQKLAVAKERSLKQILWNYENVRFTFYYLDKVSFLVYSLLGYLFFKRQKTKPVFQKISFFTRKRLRLTIIFFCVFAFINVFNFILLRYLKITLFYYYLFSIIISLLFYLIGYLAVSTEDIVENLERKSFKKYMRSSLNQNDKSAIIEKLINYIESEKPYLRGEYKLKNLSDEIKIPSHHISEVLNIYNKKSFSELINSYRVIEAKKLLLDKKYSNIKISSIGFDVGFNSQTTFYFWFKKTTGISPFKFQKKYL